MAMWMKNHSDEGSYGDDETFIKIKEEYERELEKINKQSRQQSFMRRL